jgi:hypothetical protein
MKSLPGSDTFSLVTQIMGNTPEPSASSSQSILHSTRVKGRWELVQWRLIRYQELFMEINGTQSPIQPRGKDSKFLLTTTPQQPPVIWEFPVSWLSGPPLLTIRSWEFGYFRTRSPRERHQSHIVECYRTLRD